MSSCLDAEVVREIQYAISLAMPYQVPAFLYASSLESYGDIWRSIEFLDKFTAECRMGIIDYDDWHLSDHLVVVYPGIEDRIC